MHSIDPITLGVLWGGLQAVAEEMGLALRRTAYSEAVREGLDFSTAVFDSCGRMIAQGNFSPGHLGAMPLVLKHVLAAYPLASWQPGDAVLLNDLYMGSGHLPDCFVTSPVFVDHALVGFVVNCAHQVDVGGAGPGSQNVEGVREFYQIIIGGYGARPTKDGCESLAPCFNVNNIPVEVSETNYPILIERLEFMQDSAGAGKFRGGCGLRKDIRVLAPDVTFSGLAERQTFAPYSLFGGTTPQRGRTILNPGGQQRQLHGKGVYALACGDLLHFEICGAGAYGDPLERDPLAVQQDVRNGYVSPQAAERVYGVCIDAHTLTVDMPATCAIRARRRTEVS